MTEGLFKTQSEAALDDVTARATELLELWESLEESGHTRAVHDHVGSLVQGFSRRLDALMTARRACGELPAIGNVERAQMDAAVVSIEALLPGTDDQTIAAHKLTDASARVRDAIDAALARTLARTGRQDIVDSLQGMRTAAAELIARLD